MKKLFFIFVFIFLFTTDINSEIIKNIEISGNVRISDETIILFSEIKKNQDLKNKNLNLIIKKLYTTNFFRDINIAFDDGILKISVKENPVVQTLQFKGIKNKSILEVLNDTIQLKEKSSFLKKKIEIFQLFELFSDFFRKNIFSRENIFGINFLHEEIIFLVRVSFYMILKPNAK